jgi:hypothetical protein
MHYFLALALTLAISTPGAAQQNRAVGKGTAKSNIAFLRDLTKRVEEAGYTKVRMVPQMFVVLAVRSDGKPITLIVDSNTLKAAEVEGAQEFIEEVIGADPNKYSPPPWLERQPNRRGY